MRLMRPAGRFHRVAMSGLAALSVLVTVLMLSACVAAFPELRRWPIPRWRLAVPSLLIPAAALVLLYLPPSPARQPPQGAAGLDDAPGGSHPRARARPPDRPAGRPELRPAAAVAGA